MHAGKTSEGFDLLSGIRVGDLPLVQKRESLVIAGPFPAMPFPWKEADDMLTLLIKRAAELVHCRPGSPQEEEFNSLASAIEAYEVKRWAPSSRPPLHVWRR